MVVRAAGQDYRWRDLPRPDGLRYQVLGPREAKAFDLDPGQASAWTWQGLQVVNRGGPEDVRAAIGRHLGPRPRVWIDVRDTELRNQLRRALQADGRWAVTQAYRDIKAVRAGKLDPQPCPDLTPPAVSRLQVSGDEASWYDPTRRCRSVTARGATGRALVTGLLAAWRVPAAVDAETDDGPPPARPAGPRYVDTHVRKKMNRSQRAMQNLSDSNADMRLVNAVRPWLGVRYLRDGRTAAGVDDVQLVRLVYAQVYGVELSDNPIDWLELYEKVPVDERNPAATVRPGDILFKVTYAYVPREVSIYLGGDRAATAKDVLGVVVDKTPRIKSMKWHLVARRPRR